jgi:hypothetical protein
MMKTDCRLFSHRETKRRQSKKDRLTRLGNLNTLDFYTAKITSSGGSKETSLFIEDVIKGW